MSAQTNLTLSALREALRATLPPWRRWADGTRRRCVLRLNEDVAPDAVLVLDGVDWHGTGWVETHVLMRRETRGRLVAGTEEWTMLDNDLAAFCAYQADQRRKGLA